MKRVLAGGLLLAVLGALAVWVMSALGFGAEDLGQLMFGVGCGAVLGLVATKSPLARIGGFVIGFVVTWVFYAITAQFLPLDSSMSTAVQVLLTLVVVTLIAAGLHSKIPFWSFLLGLVAFSGAYQFLFVTDVAGFIGDSVASAGAALFSGALGLLAVVVADLLPLGAGEGDDLAVVEPQFAASSSPSAKG